MNHVIERWKRGHCWRGNGFSFPDDTFIGLAIRGTLRGDIPHDGFHPKPRVALAQPELKDGWVEIGSKKTGELVDGRYRVTWGGGGFSFGWLALEEVTGELCWILHTCSVELFHEVKIEGIHVTAKAPHSHDLVFRFEIMSPEFGTVSAPGLSPIPNPRSQTSPEPVPGAGRFVVNARREK